MGFPTNIFVLCTGRCGSMTLAHACGHLTSHTVGHESRTHITGPKRLAYPEHHIEIDNRLAWFLGRLDKVWGDDAAYIHLRRDPDAVAHSFTARAHQGILKAYRGGILNRLGTRRPNTPLIDVCRDYVETVTENIDMFLSDKTHVLPMRMERFDTDFDQFLDWSGATGDLGAARAELKVRHNATTE